MIIISLLGPSLYKLTARLNYWIRLYAGLRMFYHDITLPSGHSPTYRGLQDILQYFKTGVEHS